MGKKFTLYSCQCIVLVSIFTDLVPTIPITEDLLLICVFGGLITGFAVSLCLRARATSGGTDFIAIALSERKNIDAWNYILAGNAVMLTVAGLLFGWERALYSIIFQFTSTQTVCWTRTAAGPPCLSSRDGKRWGACVPRYRIPTIPLL